MTSNAAVAAAAVGPVLPPRWARLAALGLAAAGLCVSLYLTITHYTTSVTLSCPDTGVINCAKVTTSPESMLLGTVPVAVAGLAFYILMTAACLPWAWRARWRLLAPARLGALAAGIAFVLYLVYTELFTLDAICLWCTSVHVITFALFALVALTMPGRPAGTPEG
jgi:uncharacterized membrane protein